MEEIRELIRRNSNIKHNEYIPPIPEEFKDGKNDAKFCDWIINESMLATLPLNLKIPHEEMYKEAMAQKHMFVKHRGDSSPGWSSMAIHGTAVHHTSPKESYFDKDEMPEYDWTELADLCPITKQWLQSLGFSKFNRVRFMLLDPGGYINPHRDTDDRKIHAWNVAINNPVGHKFVLDGHGIVPWKVGEVRGIDISQLHTVVNDGVEPRLHMIIHGWFDAGIANTICRSYEKLV